MGKPVQILDLARAMIELSGLDADRDIDIEVVGAQPGEKLHEELFNSYERPRPTAAEKILLADREPLAVAEVEAMFREINLLVLEGDAAGLAAKVSELSSSREHIPPNREEAREGGGEREGSSEAPLGRAARAAARARGSAEWSCREPARRACAPRTLPEFMTLIPLALSLSNSFTKIGAIVAFAGVLGVAIVALLLFSQAREIKRLREWAGRAPERAAEMEQRVTGAATARPQTTGVQGVKAIPRAGALPQAPAAAVPGAPAPVVVAAAAQPRRARLR